MSSVRTPWSALDRKDSTVQVNPYLNFGGDCREAFAFYAELLGGEITMMTSFADMRIDNHDPSAGPGGVMHARLVLGDWVLMGSDAPPEMYGRPQGIWVALVVEEPSEAERIYGGLSENGTVLMPLDETPWAERFGMLTDRFGIPWMINCERAA
jgi:PhnB protein